MGRYFDYSDWKIEEISNSIRERLAEARKPLPKKIMKHYITIKFKTGEGCYCCGYNNDWMWRHEEFTSREDAIKYMSKLCWLERIEDNKWIDNCSSKTYIDKNGNEVPYHYEIDEYDYEVYEDGEYHTEYTIDERRDLSNALHCIEKARVYLKEYDNANNNGSFGGGSFHESLQLELNKFYKEYTESLPDNYYDNE